MSGTVQLLFEGGACMCLSKYGNYKKVSNILWFFVSTFLQVFNNASLDVPTVADNSQDLSLCI